MMHLHLLGIAVAAAIADSNYSSVNRSLKSICRSTDRSTRLFNLRLTWQRQLASGFNSFFLVPPLLLLTSAIAVVTSWATAPCTRGTDSLAMPYRL